MGTPKVIQVLFLLHTILFLVTSAEVPEDPHQPLDREATVKELIDRIEFDVLTKIQKEYIPRKNFCPRADQSSSIDNVTRVTINVFIKDIRIEYVNKGLSYWTLDLILRQRWNNPRLAFNVADYPEYDYATVNSIRLMWVPDLFFPDEVKRDFGALTMSGSGSLSANNILLWIYPSGDVLYSFRLPSITLRCRHQAGSVTKLLCPLTIGTYGCTSNKLVLDWEKVNPVEVDEGLYIPFYTFAANKTVTRSKEEVTRIGNFSRIYAEFPFSRID